MNSIAKVILFCLASSTSNRQTWAMLWESPFVRVLKLLRGGSTSCSLWGTLRNLGKWFAKLEHFGISLFQIGGLDTSPSWSCQERLPCSCDGWQQGTLTGCAKQTLESWFHHVPHMKVQNFVWHTGRVGPLPACSWLDGCSHGHVGKPGSLGERERKVKSQKTCWNFHNFHKDE